MPTTWSQSRYYFGDNGVCHVCCALIRLLAPADSRYDPGMRIIFPACGVALASFCVWLTVQIINRRDRWPKWVAVALIVSAVVGYPLSIGPVAVLAPVLRIRADEFYWFYYPIYWASCKSERVDEFVFAWYRDDLWQDRFVRLWLKCSGADD